MRERISRIAVYVEGKVSRAVLTGVCAGRRPRAGEDHADGSRRASQCVRGVRGCVRGSVRGFFMRKSFILKDFLWVLEV